MAGTAHFLTPEGQAKLEKELEYLRTVRRQEVAHDLQEALEEGDISENAAYEEGKRQQAFLEGRIKDVEAILANAKLVGKNENHETVSVGARVTIEEVGYSGPTESYLIVGSAEADPTQERISNESPLGSSLLGRRVGEQVEVTTPGGTILFEIVSID